MANYAYKDNQRKEIIYSTQAIEEDRSTAFYCPNPKCNAQLYICAIDGSKTAYFRATKRKYPHVSNCPFGNSAIEFDKTQFDESNFDYDKAIGLLFAPTSTDKTSKKSGVPGIGELQNHPPRTIRQIYSMCKS